MKITNHLIKLAKDLEFKTKKNAQFLDAELVAMVQQKLLFQIRSHILLFRKDLLRFLNANPGNSNNNLEEIIEFTNKILNFFNTNIRNGIILNIGEAENDFRKFHFKLKEYNKEYVNSDPNNPTPTGIQNIIDGVLYSLNENFYKYDNMEECIREKLQEHQEQDWRPTETIPEDYYAL